MNCRFAALLCIAGSLPGVLLVPHFIMFSQIHRQRSSISSSSIGNIGRLWSDSETRVVDKNHATVQALCLTEHLQPVTHYKHSTHGGCADCRSRPLIETFSRQSKSYAPSSENRLDGRREFLLLMSCVIELT